MNFLDVLIILLAAGAAAAGYRRGVSWVSFSLLGLLIGLIVGATVAPIFARALAHRREVQPIVASSFFLSIVLILQGIGTTIGARIRIAALKTRFREIDSGLGSVLAALGLLGGAWYIGLLFSQSPWIGLDTAIRGSAIERSLDGVAPRPPAFLAYFQQVLNDSTFPNPFAHIGSPSIPPAAIPGPIDTAGSRLAAQATVRVISTGCGATESGSAWSIAPNYLVTNAHVVAGSTNVEAQLDRGTSFPATVVAYNPDVDVAVLYAPGMNIPSLRLASDDPAGGTNGAVVGYPGGGAESIVPAAVRGVESAEGYNIYNDHLITRDIEVLAATIVPGNSGGPLVDSDGTVLGLVFAASTVDPQEGYALTGAELRGDTAAADQHRTSPVSTGACVP